MADQPKRQLSLRKKAVLAGAVGGIAYRVLVRRRRNSRSRGLVQVSIPPELLETARSWASDPEFPEHVRDVAKRLLDTTTTPRSRRSVLRRRSERWRPEGL